MLFGILLAIATQPGTPGVYLWDADTFGVSPQVVAANLRVLENHTRYVVWHMPEAARWAWEFRQEQVRKAWAELGTALDARKRDVERTEALSRLRWLLGDADFFAGKLPSPIPNYGY